MHEPCGQTRLARPSDTVGSIGGHFRRIVCWLQCVSQVRLSDLHAPISKSTTSTSSTCTESSSDADEIQAGRAILSAAPARVKTQFVPKFGVHGSSTPRIGTTLWLSCQRCPNRQDEAILKLPLTSLHEEHRCEDSCAKTRPPSLSHSGAVEPYARFRHIGPRPHD